MTHSQFECEVEHNYRYNAIVSITDATFYWLGASFITAVTILPVYVSRLTDNEMALGLLSMIASTGWLLPQLFTANWVQRLPRKKVIPVNVGFFTERLPVMLLVPAAWLATRSASLALVAFFIAIAWYILGAGVIAVGWQDMIAKIIPLNRRGKFFGIANFGGAAAGVLGATFAAWLLGRYAFPYGYILCFGAAAVFIFISWVFLALTREPRQVSQEPIVSQREYWRRLPSILRDDRNFRRYLLSQVVTSMGGMAFGFIAVYAAQRWQLPDSQAGRFTTTMLVGQALSNLLFGPLADRKGHKLVLELSILLSAAAVGCASIAPAPIWFHLVFALTGAATAGFIISGTMIVFEFTTPDGRPTYIGLCNTTLGLVKVVAPLLGGWLAAVLGYQPLFILSFAVSAIGLALLHWLVREPRLAPPEPYPAPANSLEKPG